MMQDERIGIQPISKRKGLCVCSDVARDPCVSLPVTSDLRKAAGVRLQVMAKALDDVLSLRQLHTLNEAVQARDALLEAGGVERAARSVSVDTRAVREPCHGHTGSHDGLRRGNTVTWVPVIVC